MIFACRHWFGSVPYSSDAWKRSRTRCLTVGQVPSRLPHYGRQEDKERVARKCRATLPNSGKKHCQGNTCDSCMTDYRRKRRACWPSCARGWQDSMNISLESTPPRQINVHVDKQERLWTTFCFNVGNGPRAGRICYNVPTCTEGTDPRTWDGSRLQTMRNRQQT